MARPATINQIFESLAATKSKNEKIQILKDNEKNATLKLVVQKALDPFNLYYMSKIPEYKVSNASQLKLDATIDKLDQLAKRDKTGLVAKNYVRQILQKMNEADGDILRRMITKDLNIGCAASTINSAWGAGFIPVYNVMLCVQYTEKAVANLTWPTIVQEKMDGMRVNFIVSQKGIEVRSRSGKELPVGDLFTIELRNLLYQNQMNDTKSYVIDGELLVKGKDGSFLSRKKSNGILNKAIKGTITEEEKSHIYAIIWDVIPKSAFARGDYDATYKDRLTYLQNRNAVTNATFKPERRTHLISSTVCQNMEDVLAVYNEVIGRDGEGVIIKTMDGAWKNKRVPHQIKMKIENECELIIKEVLQGEGRNLGKLGAFGCESSCGGLKVNVGTGFSDQEREEYFTADMVGQVITVRFNEVISSKNAGTKSLFLPVFVNHRLDKGKANSLKVIAAM